MLRMVKETNNDDWERFTLYDGEAVIDTFENHVVDTYDILSMLEINGILTYEIVDVDSFE